MDLFVGSAQSLEHLIRLRTATVQVDWRNTSIMVGQEKPIISPREPTSLAQVGVSPLTAAGNLWLWQPQFRVEQRLGFGEAGGLRAQFSVYQTNESPPAAAYEVAYAAGSRPGLQGRFEFGRDFGSGRRIELAPGFHASTSHVAGFAIPSRVWSADWLIRPAGRVDFTGMFFAGKNVSVLGSLRQGVAVRYGRPRAVRALGGWGQVAFRATARLSFQSYFGQQDDRNRDLAAGAIGKNLAWGANSMYRLAPNIVLAVEGSTVRTTHLGPGIRRVNHYDVAVAYLF
jgi:hypothetical protein